MANRRPNPQRMVFQTTPSMPDMSQPNHYPNYDDPSVSSTEFGWCPDDRTFDPVPADSYSFPAALAQAEYPSPAPNLYIGTFEPQYVADCMFDASDATGAVTQYDDYNIHETPIASHYQQQPIGYQGSTNSSEIPIDVAPTVAMETKLSIRPRNIASDNYSIQNEVSPNNSSYSAPTRQTQNPGSTERKIRKKRKQSFLEPFMSTFRAAALPCRPLKNTHAHRRDTKAVRDCGACFKCRMWKKKCDPGTPCKNCQNDRCSDQTMVAWQPCFRLDLDDCGVFRNKSASWRKPLRSHMEWITQDTVELCVQYAAVFENSPSLKLKCRLFQPEFDDIVTRQWGHHPDQSISIPAYCAVDTRKIISYLEPLVQGYAEYYRQQMITHPWTVPGIEPAVVPKIVALTFDMAMKHKSRSTILPDALRIWVGSRLCAARRTLRGKNCLGVPVITVAGAPDYGYRPIPPMLDYQLDTAMIQWMELNAKLMLKKLWEVLRERNKENWFHVFLTMFILIHNLEVVYQSQEEYANLYGNAAYGTAIRNASKPMLDHWRRSAKHLLFVYDYHMRRATFGGAPIFKPSFLSQAVAFADLDPQDQEYLESVIQWSSDNLGRGIAADDNVQQMSWCRNLMSDSTAS